MMGLGAYLQRGFLDIINKDLIHIIFECGSRDCLDAIDLRNYFSADLVYSFECNPECFLVCERNIKGIDNIKLVKKAVHKVNGTSVFYATDMEKSKDKNIGASSLLKHIDSVEYIQKEIIVDTIRLDTFMEQEGVDHIDLLCMDLQGAEHWVLTGLGKMIRKVRYIITEVMPGDVYYEGCIPFLLFDRLIIARGFARLVRIGDDVLYVNTKYYG